MVLWACWDVFVRRVRGRERASGRQACARDPDASNGMLGAAGGRSYRLLELTWLVSAMGHRWGPSNLASGDLAVFVQALSRSRSWLSRLFFRRLLAGPVLQCMPQPEPQRTSTALWMVRRPGNVDFRHPLSMNGGPCDWLSRPPLSATRCARDPRSKDVHDWLRPVGHLSGSQEVAASPLGKYLVISGPANFDVVETTARAAPAGRYVDRAAPQQPPR